MARGQIHPLIDGQTANVAWQGDYATFTLGAGQVASLRYPLAEYSRDYAIAGQHYRGAWRGSTMVTIEPAGEGYPIYQRQALIADPQALGDSARWATELPAASPFLW